MGREGKEIQAAALQTQAAARLHQSLLPKFQNCKIRLGAALQFNQVVSGPSLPLTHGTQNALTLPAEGERPVQ
jgi:hypothetical protein